MPVPLTLQHGMRMTQADCTQCATLQTKCVVCVVETEGRKDITRPVCFDCIEFYAIGNGGNFLTTMVLEPVDYGKGVRPPSRAMQKKASRRERKIAERIGGRAQPGSGNQAHAKGDVRKKGHWRVQDKTSRNKSFPLTRQLINEIRSQCSYGEKFAITVGFLNKMTQREEDEVVVIDKNVWEELVNVGDHS